MSSIEKAMRRTRPATTQGKAAKRRPEVDDTTERRDPRRVHPLDQPGRVPDITFDHQRLSVEGLLTPKIENTKLREQYRMVKRKLITQAFVREQVGSKPANLIQITSALGNEGKTFTSFNLGMSIAMERDITVLLVDADLTRRSLTKLVGLSDREGLTDVLTGKIDDLREVIYRTDVPRLSIIPAGEGHADATELIASEIMRNASLELAGRYRDRLIIFDTTPLLMDSQSATLASHMGQVLVVVEAGRTHENLLRDAIGHLDQFERPIQLLLNKSPRGHAHTYYGSY